MKNAFDVDVEKEKKNERYMKRKFVINEKKIDIYRVNLENIETYQRPLAICPGLTWEILEKTLKKDLWKGLPLGCQGHPSGRLRRAAGE